MAGRLDRLESVLDRAGRAMMSWWVWPAVLTFAGALALAAALTCYPVENDVHAFGYDLMGPCEFREINGQPCASCGMTRSWVWAARGHVLTALRYNIAGTLLFFGLVAGGVVGVARLVTRNKDLLRLHWAASGTLVTGWVVLYAVTWAFRLAGLYPLD